MNECEDCTHRDDAPQAWAKHEKDCKASQPEFVGVKDSIRELSEDFPVKTTVRESIFLTALKRSAVANWDVTTTANPFLQQTALDHDTLALYPSPIAYMDHLVRLYVQLALKLQKADIQWFRAYGNHHPERNEIDQNSLPHLISVLLDMHLPTKTQHAAFHYWIRNSEYYGPLDQKDKKDLIISRAKRPTRGHVQYDGKQGKQMNVLDLKVSHFYEHRLAAVLRVTPGMLRTSIVNNYNRNSTNQAVGRAVSFLFWYHSHRFNLMEKDDVVRNQKFYLRYRAAVASRISARPATADLMKKMLLHIDEMEEEQSGSRAMLFAPSTTIRAADREERDDLFSDLKERCGFQTSIIGLTDLLIAARKAEEAAAVKHARELKGFPLRVTTWEGTLVRIVARVFIKQTLRPATYAQEYSGVIKAVVARVQKKFGARDFTDDAIRAGIRSHADKINRWIDRLQTEEDVWKEEDEAHL
ncbi:hypothetical protein NCC49_002327 [Naganishia albida]|nr:hypothetical protein NCC49_002327 [Naganishia albida]